ncbi:MAG: MFS transporter [Dehalococcoidia bacterium]|jgi:cyanate permease
MLSNLSKESIHKNEKYRWFLLALLAAIGTFVASIQQSCMPVLFKEISDDLGLDLVQIGTIWGINSLAGIFISILAGFLSDRFGLKLVLSVLCVMSGITGALRGISNSYLVLATTVFLNGIFRLIIPVTITKTIGIWFKGKNLGLAMGIYVMGLGLGLMLGSMISSSVLSPFLGGWRNVLYLYGAIAVVMGIVWILFGREPHHITSNHVSSNAVPLRQSISKLIRNKALWLIGLMFLFRMGCLMGVAGYLPLYLREQGWEAARADGVLAAFYAISTLCAIPLSFLSDRLGLRKPILYLALVVALICVSLIPVVEDRMIWFLILLTGVFMDGSISITFTILLETEGINSAYSGTATGLLYTLTFIGIVVSPPLGNSLANINLGTPFFFWASLSVPALIMLILTKETGSRGTQNIITQ